MAEVGLVERSGLEGLLATAKHGTLTSGIGVTLTLRQGLGIATVMARKGMREKLARRVQKSFELSLPGPLERSNAGPIAFAWSGPDQWLATAEGVDRLAFESLLRTELSRLASITSQSDGRTIIRVSGPKAREALAKGLPLDLHPRAFGPGNTAGTVVAHVGVQLWQLDDKPTYEFAVFRSFAVAFCGFLIESSAEFGYEFQ